jgi:hypothetical protein
MEECSGTLSLTFASRSKREHQGRMGGTPSCWQNLVRETVVNFGMARDRRFLFIGGIGEDSVPDAFAFQLTPVALQVVD